MNFNDGCKLLPNVLFNVRIRDDSLAGDNPYRWSHIYSRHLFEDKRSVVFSLPGAFTPTCSTYQLPDFERLYPQFQKHGINDIYCISVNDSFVMNKWAKDQNLQHVKVIPDGNGEFTRLMGMLVKKDIFGFGMRSWRYAMIVDDNVVLKMFVESGMHDNVTDDPYGKSSPQYILKYLDSGV